RLFRVGAERTRNRKRVKEHTLAVSRSCRLPHFLRCSVLGPAVVRFDEIPMLPRYADLDWVLLNVRDRAPDVLRRIEEYLPARSAPCRMRIAATTSHNKRRPAGILKPRDHLLREVSMFADDQVDVIGHDCAGVTRVLTEADHFRNGIRDC